MILDKISVDIVPTRGKFIVVGDPHLSSRSPVSRRDEYPETMIEKLRWILKKADEEADFVVFLGDMLHIKDITLPYLVRVIELLNETKIPKFTIAGNHDLLYGREDTLGKVPLGLMVVSQAVQRLGRIGYGQVGIVGMDFDKEKKIPLKGDRKQEFLVAHLYWENSLFDGGEETLRVEEVISNGYQGVILGHDHTFYNCLTGKDDRGLIVIRPGSIARGTKDEYSKDREVQIAEVILGGSGTVDSVKFVKVPTKPVEEVFSIQRIDRESILKKVRSFVESLSITKKSGVLVLDKLKELCSGDDKLETRCKEFLTGGR